MIENRRPGEENIIKDIRNLLRLKWRLNYTAMKDIRNLFTLEKETKVIKGRKLTHIENLFEREEEENYYKPRVNNFWIKNYIKYESNGDRNKTLPVEDHI